MKKYSVVVLSLIAIFVWFVALSFDNQLKIIACDVGQGDALLLQEGTFQVLIDGGPDESVLGCLGEFMPFWDKKIELVLLTHPEADHYTGLIEVNRRYEIEKFIANPIKNDTEGYRLLTKELLGNGISATSFYAGDQIVVGKMNFVALNPFSQMVPEARSGELNSQLVSENLNSYSIVTVLTYGSFKALFTGDIIPEQIEYMLSRVKLGQVTLLKVPHHGSHHGLTYSMLDQAKPSASIISVAKKNKFGHPHKEVLDILNQNGGLVLQTADIGHISITTDGNAFWVNK